MQTRWKVFAVIYRPTPLLAHFVRHYAALGFTDVVLAAGDLCRDVDWPAIRQVAGDAVVHVEPLYQGVFDNGRDTGVLNGLKARYVEDRHEWSAQADLDELYEYPMPLPDLSAAAGEANCVQGWFVDRVETCMTKRILGGCDRKLILTRGFQCIARGHHSMSNERLFPPHGRVLHYKWNSIVLDHLAERLAMRERTGYQWGHESERFLAYWQKHGRIVFEDCV
jgi:hypothetical protein